MKMFNYLLILILLTSVAYSFPLTYTYQCGKIMCTETIQVPDIPANQQIFQNLTGKTIVISSAHTSLDGWTIEIEHIEGS